MSCNTETVENLTGVYDLSNSAAPCNSFIIQNNSILPGTTVIDDIFDGRFLLYLTYGDREILNRIFFDSIEFKSDFTGKFIDSKGEVDSEFSYAIVEGNLAYLKLENDSDLYIKIKDGGNNIEFCHYAIFSLDKSGNNNGIKYIDHFACNNENSFTALENLIERHVVNNDTLGVFVVTHRSLN